MNSEIRILIAEDEKIIAKDIALTLGRLGYSVIDSAASVEQIIKKARELKPDLVLMDILLDGDATGIEAAQIIQQNFDIPVVYLTALADENTINKAKITDAYGYVLKPFDEKTLRSAVEMALYKHKINLKLRQRTEELEEEKVKSDNLLHNIFPVDVAAELKEKGVVEPREYESVTLLFTDFEGFTKLSTQMSPSKLVFELNDIFKSFDLIIDHFKLEKLKTIGDSYMVGGGFPKECDDHAIRVISAALEMQKYIICRNETSQYKWKMRVGAHSGKIIAGVVGKNKYTYDVWGDTVNIANRMERYSQPGKINISSATYSLIKDHFKCEFVRDVDLVENGKIDMFHVIGEFS